MRVLVVNAGSSSLKLSLLDEADRTLAAHELPAASARRPSELRALLHDVFVSAASADVIGHRIVHGGERFGSPVLIDNGVRAELEQLVALAPLHQGLALAGLGAVSE